MTFSDNVQDDSTIALRDGAGQTLLCQIEQTFEIDSHQYALLLPVDTPVEIFMWEEEAGGEEESLVDIDDSQIDTLFPTARAVLAERDLMLQRTAVTLTVTGDIPELQDEDCFTLEIDDEDADEADVIGEEFQTLVSFFHHDVEYTICTPVDPLLLFAKITANGSGQIIPPEEFERLRPYIESTIFDVLN